jgi:hypothetical protein
VSRHREQVTARSLARIKARGPFDGDIAVVRLVVGGRPRDWYVIDIRDGTIIARSRARQIAGQTAAIVRRDLRRDARKIELCYSSPPSPFI